MTAPARRLLVPVDGSDAGGAALDVAASLARELGGTVTLLAIAAAAPPTADPLTGIATALPERQQVLDQLAQEQLGDATARIGDGVDVRTSLSWAPAGAAIVEHAETGEHDAVVVPWPERGALGHLLHDHAVRHVLAHCRLPVLVVPNAR